MRLILVVLFSLTTQFSLANQVPQNGFTQDQLDEMASYNEVTQLLSNDLTANNNRGNSLLTTTDVRAFAEYEKAGYLIFSSSFAYSSEKAKLEMARNLPEGVKLVVYTGSTSVQAAKKLKKKFADVLSEDRIYIVHMPNAGRGFWARDGVPVPVLRRPKVGQSTDEFLTLVDARYYHHFEADAQFGELFSSDLTEHDYYYEGGNFMANDQNGCIVINTSATQKVPDSVFTQHYGCLDLLRLPHVKGIGHADESVKFIDANTVLTDEPTYVAPLKARGYKVIPVPRPDRKYETYVNSLMIDDVVYVPIFKEDNDAAALQIYKDLGFKKVIGIRSNDLSNNGLGSLHCITMTYPVVPISDLLKSMGGHILQ